MGDDYTYLIIQWKWDHRFFHIISYVHYKALGGVFIHFVTQYMICTFYGPIALSYI